MFRRRLKKNEEKGLNIFNICFSIFLISWFLAGNAWVYQTVSRKQFDHRNYDSNPNYCDQICYLVAFWIITSIWIIISLLCLLCFFCCFIVLIVNRRKGSENNNQTNLVNNNHAV